MRVLFNALIMTDKSFGYASVISSYLSHIHEYLTSKSLGEFKFVVVCQRRALGLVDPDEVLRKSPLFEFKVLPNMENVLLRALVEQVYLNVLAVQHRCDVIHMPATLGLVRSVRKQVLFFHATTTFMLDRAAHGRGRLSTYLHNLVIRLSARSADILAVSTQTTAEELLNYLGKRRDYTVIGEGIKDFEEESSLPQEDVVKAVEGKKFVLFTSSFYELKNQKVLIDAFGREGMQDLHLVLVGNAVQANYYGRCVASKTDNVLILKHVTDGTLRWLYEHASLYTSPSKFEGFSMTPFEALKCGTPVLLSDIPVHREVYGGAFIYFDPGDVDDALRGVRSGLEPGYRERCQAGLRDLEERFSWDQFLEKNLALYRLANNG